MNLANNPRNSNAAKFGNTGPGGGAVSQACAACKYQRRRCPPDCTLAPHFPADKQNDFRNVRKAFGVKNITRTLKELPPDQHQTAVKSIVFEANLRAVDPVGGCLRKVCELNQSLRICTAELNLVRQQLAVCRSLVPLKDVKFAKHGNGCNRVIEEHDGEFDGPLGFDHQELMNFNKKASKNMNTWGLNPINSCTLIR
ncbi:LOB domain-containing protein 22-like [Dorcoceras hygrometricum]|uniref:LOB domain-containing protein 22-like n=1 Tax=Dorcoceras hygrometricum TaxID=472368 RepID=A0A2Z7D008_9LAMI|nr:LOB domain-containing protein 22-like [Dorcoceras hygrometricum]